MSAKRVFYGMVGLFIGLAGVGIAILILGNSMLQHKSAGLVNLKLQSQVLDSQQTALQQAKKDVIKYTPLNTVAETIVPQEKDQAQTVREIIDFAAKAGIKIGSITFPASSLGQLGVSGSGVSSHAALTQLTPVKGIAGIYQMPITIQSDAASPTTFTQLINFLQLLENNRHTAQVSQLTITPADSNSKQLSFTLMVNVYIKP